MDIIIPANTQMWTTLVTDIPKPIRGVGMNIEKACSTAEDIELNRNGLLQTTKIFTSQSEIKTTICYLTSE